MVSPYNVFPITFLVTEFCTRLLEGSLCMLLVVHIIFLIYNCYFGFLIIVIGFLYIFSRNDLAPFCTSGGGGGMHHRGWDGVSWAQSLQFCVAYGKAAALGGPRPIILYYTDYNTILYCTILYLCRRLEAASRAKRRIILVPTARTF